MFRHAIFLLAAVAPTAAAGGSRDVYKMKDIIGCSADEIAAANAAQAALYDCDAGIIGKTEIEGYQEALLDKEDGVLAGKIMLEVRAPCQTVSSRCRASPTRVTLPPPHPRPRRQCTRPSRRPRTPTSPSRSAAA